MASLDSSFRAALAALPRNVWVVTATSFLTDVSSEMLTTLLPLYLSGVLGARTAAIGLVEGVAEATASLLKLVSGWLSDRLRRRKSLAVAGYAISTLAKPCLLFVSSWVGVLAVRFADRVGKGVRTAPRDALVADSTEPAQRGLAFGLHRAGDTAGAVVGLSVALVVMLAVDPTGRALSSRAFWVLVVASVVPAALAVLVLGAFARDVPIAAAPRPAPRLTLAPFDARFRRFLLVLVVFTLGNSSDAFLVLRAREAGMTVTGILGMMIAFNLVYTLAAGPAGALSDRVGRRRLVLAGWLVYAGVYLGFALVNSVGRVWFLMTVYGLYHALTEGAVKAYVADLVQPEARGVAYGVMNAAIGFVALPASVLAGVVWQGLGPWPGFGPSAPFLLGSALALTAAFLLMMLVPDDC